MGKSDLGWLKSLFHFSFAEYQNPANIDFGVLRVLNDDIIAPHTGFDTHPHRDMEIVSYIVHGQLTHRDSMGNTGILERGHVQYMSAGTGVLHSEHNEGEHPLRILQLWFYPDRKNHTPQYGEHRFVWEDRHNKWLPLVSGSTGQAPIVIHQDASIFAATLQAGHTLPFELSPHRALYLVQIEGESHIQGNHLKPRDALQSLGQSLSIQAHTDSHFLLIEMPQGNS